MTEISAAGGVAEAAGEVLAVPVFSELRWGPGAEWAVEALGEPLDRYLEGVSFAGKRDQVVVLPTRGAIPFDSLLLVGMGDETDAEGVRRAAGWVGRHTTRRADVGTTLHLLEVEEAAQAVAEGFLLGQYRFAKYRSEPEEVATERLRLFGGDAARVGAQAARGTEVAEAVALARDLVNEPAAGKPPATLAALAEGLADDPRIRVKVHDESDIIEGGFGGLAGVAAGAHVPPRLVEVWYEPAGAGALLALVGKGVVFDSGGLSLKKPDAMESMKTDMAGAAAVLAAVQAIAGLDLPVRVLAITPLTENMPGGGAIRPGDVVRARNGKTIEVLNTDAEGRLLLADGLSLAAEAAPDLIVDLATLTGACRVALGDKIAGVWSNDAAALGRLEAAAARAGERVWPMPLPDDYRSNIDSDIADMKNTGGRHGAAINAALLLREFVGDVPWVHLDVAGPARWPESEHYQSKGGSGFGVRTLVALAEDLAEGR